MAFTNSAKPAEASSKRADWEAIKWLTTFSPATQMSAVSKAKRSSSLALFRAMAAIRKTNAGSNSQTLGVGLWGEIRGGRTRQKMPATRQAALTRIDDNAATFFLGSRGHGNHLFMTQ